MVLSSTLTPSSVPPPSSHRHHHHHHHHARRPASARRVVHVRTYDWPTYQVNAWLFVMLLAASSVLGVTATFMQTQAQMHLPVPWYLPYDVTVAAVALAFLLGVAWLVWLRRLLPAVVVIGALALFVMWTVGVAAGGVALWGPDGVQSACSSQVWNQSPHAPDVQTLAWLQQRNICQSWYLVFAMGLTGEIFLIWVIILSYQVFVRSMR